jgi:hypothetical protein
MTLFRWFNKNLIVYPLCRGTNFSDNLPRNEYNPIANLILGNVIGSAYAVSSVRSNNDTGVWEKTALALSSLRRNEQFGFVRV